jgi:hypothetical protein
VRERERERERERGFRVDGKTTEGSGLMVQLLSTSSTL